MSESIGNYQVQLSSPEWLKTIQLPTVSYSGQGYDNSTTSVDAFESTAEYTYNSLGMGNHAQSSTLGDVLKTLDANASDWNGQTISIHDKNKSGEWFHIQRKVDVVDPRTLRTLYMSTNWLGSNVVSTGVDLHIDDNLDLIVRQRKEHTTAYYKKDIIKAAFARNTIYRKAPNNEELTKNVLTDLIETANKQPWTGGAQTVYNFISNYIEALTVAIKQETDEVKREELVEKYRDFVEFIKPKLSLDRFQKIYSKVNDNLIDDGLNLEIADDKKYGPAQHEMRILALNGELQEIKDSDVSTARKMKMLAEKLTEKVEYIGVSWSNQELINDYIQAYANGLKEIGIVGFTEDQLRKIVLDDTDTIRRNDGNQQNNNLTEAHISDIISSIHQDQLKSKLGDPFVPDSEQLADLKALFGDAIKEDTVFFIEEFENHSNIFAVRVDEDKGFTVNGLRIFKNDTSVNNKTLIAGTVQQVSYHADSIGDFTNNGGRSYNLAEVFRKAESADVQTLDDMNAEIFAVSNMFKADPNQENVKKFLLSANTLKGFNNKFSTIERILTSLEAQKNNPWTAREKANVEAALTQAGINGIDLPEPTGRPEKVAIETLIDTLNTKKTEMIDSYKTHEANVNAYGVESSVIDEMRKIVFADLVGDAYAPFAVEETEAPETTPEPAATTAPETTPEPAATTAPETTPEPAATTAPETTPEPASTTAPEATPEPAATTAPEATPAPASTSSTATPATTTAAVDANAATKEAIRKLMYESNSLNSAHKDFVLNLFLELSRGGDINGAEEDKLKSLLLDRKLIEYKDIDLSQIANDTDFVNLVINSDAPFTVMHQLADDLAPKLAETLPNQTLSELATSLFHSGDRSINDSRINEFVEANKDKIEAEFNKIDLSYDDSSLARLSSALILAVENQHSKTKTPEIETKGDYSDVQEITMNADQVKAFLADFAKNVNFSSDLQNLLRQEELMLFFTQHPEAFERLKEISKIENNAQKQSALSNFVEDLSKTFDFTKVPGFYEAGSDLQARSTFESIQRSNKTDEKMNDMINLLRFKFVGNSTDVVKFDRSEWEELSAAQQEDAKTFFRLVFGENLDTPEEWEKFLNSNIENINANITNKFDDNQTKFYYINNAVCANVARNFDSYMSNVHLPYLNNEPLSETQQRKVSQYSDFIEANFSNLEFTQSANQERRKVSNSAVLYSLYELMLRMNQEQAKKAKEEEEEDKVSFNIHPQNVYTAKTTLKVPAFAASQRVA